MLTSSLIKLSTDYTEIAKRLLMMTDLQLCKIHNSIERHLHTVADPGISEPEARYRRVKILYGLRICLYAFFSGEKRH